MKILWIAFVWPEPGSSAAGIRTMELIENCQRAGFEVQVVSACQPNVHQQALAQKGITTAQFAPNDSNFDLFLQEYNPAVVFFDRFIIEEQFSFRVQQICPHALRVLDTIDLHAVRRIRQQKHINKENVLTITAADFNQEDGQRELSSIYRCDLSLIISDWEYQFLVNQIGVSADSLQLLRFSYPAPSVESYPPFENRNNFVAIGNCNHAPNVDSFRYLHDEIWPQIKAGLPELPNVELHIYGAYPTPALLKLDNPKSGFRVKGWADDARATLAQYRVNLCPLRFGAGIKGKISDGWSVGTPALGTTIAAEGMHEQLPFGGVIEDEPRQFAASAIKLFQDKDLWYQSQQYGFEIINALYNCGVNQEIFISSLVNRLNEQAILKARRNNIFGSILWYQKNRSTEYFSRWIELKNQIKKEKESV